jgi:hypothetical protein
VAAHRVVSGVRAVVANVAIGRLAVVLMVTVPAVIEAHAVIVPVADVHSKWLPRLNLKS